MKTLLLTSLLLTLNALANDPWDKPLPTRLTLTWDRSGNDVVRYNVYYRSDRTTNWWTLAGTVVNSTNATGSGVVVTPSSVIYTPVIDMSVPVETVVTTVTTDGAESRPSWPVKHLAVTPPAPSHRKLSVSPIAVTDPPAVRRSRAVLPPVPPPVPDSRATNAFSSSRNEDIRLLREAVIVYQRLLNALEAQ